MFSFINQVDNQLRGPLPPAPFRLILALADLQGSDNLGQMLVLTHYRLPDNLIPEILRLVCLDYARIHLRPPASDVPYQTGRQVRAQELLPYDLGEYANKLTDCERGC